MPTLKPPGASPGLSVTLDVNGSSHTLAVDIRSTLLDVLRNQLGLTGTKHGCGHGQCGACTVLVDGRSSLACLMLAAQASDRAVTTIEGVSPQGGPLHPLQQAFLDHDALQCGYCTPGQIMSALAYLRGGHAEMRDNIRDNMSGNICRCGAYAGIVAAIEQAARGAGPD